MKKKIAIVTTLILAVMISACGSGDVKRTVSAASAASVAKETEAPPVSSSESENTEISASTDVDADTGVSVDTGAEADVDIDLTKLSKTMVYAEVYNIMMEPEQYVGKTIRMAGEYYIYVDEETGMQYFYCVIQDATACCAQGIEFILTDDYKFPDDYPEEGTNVTVVGRFDTYMEGEYLYCTLRDAVLEN